jgi:hypothetical protein
MVGGTVEHEEEIVPGKLSRQHVEEGLEAGRVRCRHDQIIAIPVLWRDRAVQIDVFANELGGDLGPDADRGPPALRSRSEFGSIDPLSPPAHAAPMIQWRRNLVRVFNAGLAQR